MTTDCVLGIDLGGTKIACGAVDLSGRVTHVRTAPTPAHEGADAILRVMHTLGSAVRAEAEGQGARVRAAGVGAAGVIDYAHGRVRYASPTISGWAGAEIARTLRAAFDLPVAVDNDANVWALGEQRFGAGRPFQHALYIAVGTGVGGALVMNGQLWRGHSYSAGEVGTLLTEDSIAARGRGVLDGRLESYASGPAIAADYCARAGKHDLDLRTVAALAAAGDPLAVDAITAGAQVLGRALCGLLNTLDPEALIVGGGVAGLGALWWDPLLSVLRANPMPGPAQIDIRAAELGTDAPIAGAGALAFEAVKP